MHNTSDFKISVDTNPVYLSALGVAPLVAISKSLLTGIFIGTVFVVTLFVSALIISSLRVMVPQITRLAYILIITSACVSAIDLLTQSIFYQLNLSAGIYLPLITMNSLVLFYLESQALKNPPRSVIWQVLQISGLVLLICLVVGMVRETLSHGGIFLDLENLSTISGGGISILPVLMNLSIFNTAAGAFIITGCVFALINILLNKISQ